MIEVIRIPKKLKMRCSNCMATLRFKIEDIEDNPSTSNTRWIHCPNCEAKLIVKDAYGDFVPCVHV